MLASIAAGMLATAGARVWTDVKLKARGRLFGQLSTVARYAGTLPSDTALVFVSDPGRSDFLRAGLPPHLFDRIELVRADLVNSVPDLGRTDPLVILAVEALTRCPLPVDGQQLGPGVELVRGPVADVPAGVPARAPPAGTLALLTGACLLVLLLTGLGWALALTELPALGAIGIAPAFGLAIVGLFGLIADRAGVPLRGPGGWGVLIVVAGLGGALAAWTRRASASNVEAAAPGP